jgi:hypothetical protein
MGCKSTMTRQSISLLVVPLLRHAQIRNSSFAVWQSADHCASFVQGAAYPDFLAALKPAAAGELELHHVHAGSVDPSVALSAPTTEFVLFTLKAGVTMAEISPLFEELARGLDAAKGARPSCLWAPTKDSANQVLVFVGWDTVEV